MACIIETRRTERWGCRVDKFHEGFRKLVHKVPTNENVSHRVRNLDVLPQA